MRRVTLLILFINLGFARAVETKLYLYTYLGQPHVTPEEVLALNYDFRLLDPPRTAIVDELRAAEAGFHAAGHRISPNMRRLPTAYTLRPGSAANGFRFQAVLHVLSPEMSPKLPGEGREVRRVAVTLKDERGRFAEVPLSGGAKFLTFANFKLDGEGLLIPEITREGRMEIGADLRRRNLEPGLTAKRVYLRVDLALDHETVPAFFGEYPLDRFRREFYLAESRFTDVGFLYNTCRMAFRSRR